MRAKGGAAAVTVSECMVHPQTDGSHAYHLGESILNSLACTTYTADAIRRHGAIPSIELSHSGMYSGTYMTDKTKQHGMAQWGSSACTRPGGMAVGELGRDMIGEIVAAYGHAAGLAGCECAIHLAQEGKTVRCAASWPPMPTSATGP